MTNYSKFKINIDDSNFLQFSVDHYESKYRVCVTKYTRLDRSGLVETCPFDKGNFNIVVTTGRKSEKKLKAISDFINTHLEDLYKQWSEEKYQELAQRFFDLGRII